MKSSVFRNKNNSDSITINNSMSARIAKVFSPLDPPLRYTAYHNLEDHTLLYFDL